ncbi:hypothetical protein Tco_0272337 [Tanacetum coccineum]
MLKQREEKRIEREQAANLAIQKEKEEQAAQSFTPYWNFPIIDDDDDEYTIQYREYLERSSKAITPDLPTEEPDYSLSMGDEHLDSILEIESDETDSLLEKFTGELAPINPIPPGIHEADFDPKEDIRLDDQIFYDDTSSDDDSFEDIDYVEASPPDSKLISIEEVEDDILCAKLSNIYLLIAKIESLNDNPTPSFLSYSNNSLPEFETFSNHTEETRSGSTTTHAENFLPKYDSFHFEIESDQNELSRAVMETIDKIDAFLDINVSTDLEDGYHDSEGDIIYLESLLMNNTIPNLSPEVRILIKKDKIKAKRTKPGTGMERARETKAEGVYILNRPTLYLLYGSAGVRVITAAGGRSYKENSRFGSSYDDKSWFGKGYIYRNCILPIFLAGLSLSTCKHIHLFWSHSVIPTGHLVLAGFIMFLLIVGLGFCWFSDSSVTTFWDRLFDNHQLQEIPEVIPFIESKEWIETKNELYKMIEAYTERMNQQREQEALLAAQTEQELLAQKQAAQEKEEPPQKSDFRQLIEEICGTKVCEEQKQNMEDTMLELLKDCRQKEIYCAHNDVDDLIESALNSKLLSIKSKSQRLVPEKQEVKNIAEPAAIRRTHITSYPHSFNAESNLIESLLNCDTLIDSSPKFDYLLEEFSGELAHIDPIPPGIVDTDFEPEEEIRLAENLSYDKSSPRPLKELNAEIADTIIESLSPPPIPVEDGDSLMEEIDLFLESDDSVPPGIKNNDYDSEGDIRFLEELLSNDSPPLPENESSNLDYVNDSSSPRPPPEPLMLRFA